jgi:hypothetical protein
MLETLHKLMIVFYRVVILIGECATNVYVDHQASHYSGIQVASYMRHPDRACL